MSEEEKREQPGLPEEVDISSIEIRSEEVQEIMGFIPHWIIRWGITLFFAVVIVFLIGSWFFKYPDVIQSSIVVTTETPPAAIVARTTGKIQQLFVQDNQHIKADENIAILENPADYNHLLEVKKKLAILEPLLPHYDTTVMVLFDKNYSLGPLQTTYSAFLKSYRNYHHFIQLDLHSKKIRSIEQQINRQQVLYDASVRQTDIMEREFVQSKEQYERAGKLYKDGIISKNDYESTKSTYWQKEYNLEGARSSLASQKIQLAQLEQSILDLRLQYRESKKQLELALNQAYDNLVGQIAQWEQDYLLKAPIEGVVTFTKYWSVNQNVRSGDVVVTVVPENAGGLVGKVVLPMQGAGKVKVGQQVNIKFLNYPHVDFGMVTGVIKSISLIASDNNYTVEVELPDGLKTSYDEELPFSHQMQGSAEIITEDIRLLERIFKPIKSILKRM
jgi:HlyD family secretion protein